MFLNAESIIQAGGLLAIAFIVFAESGLLFGFIFPGDTLLLTAGFFAAQGSLPIIPLIIIIVLAAIIGDNVGYQTGRRFGPSVFKRHDGLLFRHEYIEKADKFYKKHGGKTIILARFFPAVRTFAPIVAGVGKMSWPYFAAYNVIGGLLWGVTVTMLGYLIGNAAPDVDQYFFWGIIIAAHVFLLLMIYQVLKSPDVRRRLKKALKEDWQHFFARKK
ncbi:VTT domain-containing protein [Candidatus Saccharibacteria bacterium]|nr:VTT domain-containing protein [Candidatus Saccharibacteria bacterium]